MNDKATFETIIEEKAPETEEIHKPLPPITAIVPISQPRSLFTMTDTHIERLKILSEMLVKTGFTYSQIDKRPAKAGELFVLMLKGLEIGLEPMAALDFIDPIRGKPALKPVGMMAVIWHSQQLESLKIDSQPDRCTVTMKRKGQEPHTETFTEQNARDLGLFDKQGSPYKTQPATMYKWRAVGACARVVFSDIIGGMYLTTELDTNIVISDSGEIIEGEYHEIGSPSGTSEKPKKADMPSKVVDFPGSSGNNTTWLTEDAKDTIRTWLRQKYDMTYEEGLILVGLEGQDWDAKFADGKAVGAAVVEAIKNAPPATPKKQATQPPAPQPEPETDNEPVDSRKPADTWTDQADLDFSEMLWLRFEHGQADFLDKLGKQTFNKDYASPKAAWAACVSVVLKENWPVVVDSATYNGSYITFQGPLQIRMYGRSSKFKEMVGDTYYAANNIEAWTKGDTRYEIEPLRITWERKGSDNTQYLTATKCEPVYIEETESGEPSEDPEMDEFIKMFGPEPGKE